MFSDLRSVRSLPTSGQKRGPPRSVIEPPDLYSPSECTPSRSYKGEHWRNNLHPEVDEHYRRIMRGEVVSWAGRNEKESKKMPTTEGSGSSGESLKGSDEKVRSLQQQNKDLRDELYYLREALLVNFTQREQHMADTGE